jgi:hypothetical protein
MGRKLGTNHLWKEVSRNFKADHFLHKVKLPVSGEGKRRGTIHNFTRTERGSKQLHAGATDRNYKLQEEERRNGLASEEGKRMG